jgi:hypothetical protein
MEILSPRNGEVVTFQVVELSGRNATPNKVLWCQLGSRSYQFGTDASGCFTQKIVLDRGDNTIVVHGGQAPLEVSLRYEEETPKRIWVELVWDTDGTDIDLHVLEPDGEMVYFGQKESAKGGRLDVDDMNGFGPEHYTLGEMPVDRPIPGRYVVWVNYYRGCGVTTCTVRWRVDGGSLESREATLRENRPGALDPHELADQTLQLPFAQFITSIDLPAEPAFQQAAPAAPRPEPVAAPVLAPAAPAVAARPRTPVLVLTNETGKTLKMRVSTTVGRRMLQGFGDDARFFSDAQFSVSCDESGKWSVRHNSGAPNATMVNGQPLTAAQDLNDGDVLAVGNPAKGIIKLPLTVRFE